MEFLTNTLGSVLDFINNFARTVSEKFTGEDSGAVLVMVMFYLIAIILILLLFMGIVRVVKDLFRTIFSSQKKKKTRVMPTDNSATSSNNKTTQATINDGVGVENKKQTKSDDELSLIKNFGNKKYIDDLSRILNKINELDNCAVQSQHISNTTPPVPVTSEDGIVLTETRKETIKKQVEGKDLNELRDLLKQAKKEDVNLDDTVKSLGKDLAKAMQKREKLVQQESNAIDQHNNAVDALSSLCDELSERKSDLLEKHSEILNFITGLGDKKAILLDSINEFIKEISSLSEKNQHFEALCDKEYEAFVRSFQQKEERLGGFKKNYTVALESRNKIDEDISAIQQKQSIAATDKALNSELVATVIAKINELEELEKERLAREEAERIERERQAKLEAERLEKERLAREEAERLERERQAKLEAERIEKERLAKEEAERIERERQAKLEAERLEKERLAKEEAERIEREHQAKLEAERIEKERLAKEEAERIERERQAKLEAERLEKERLAREEAERLERERQAKLEAARIEREKEEALKRQEIKTKIIAETNPDSVEGVSEIKEQIKRQQQNSYSINYDDLSPKMLEQMALAEKKKRLAAEKAAKLNGKTINKPEGATTGSNKPESDSKGDGDNGDKPAKTEDKVSTQNVAVPQEEAAPQTDYVAKLKQQWAEEEANSKRWAAEKARRKEEEQRRKKELAEELAGDGVSDNNE